MHMYIVWNYGSCKIVPAQDLWQCTGFACYWSFKFIFLSAQSTVSGWAMCAYRSLQYLARTFELFPLELEPFCTKSQFWRMYHRPLKHEYYQCFSDEAAKIFVFSRWSNFKPRWFMIKRIIIPHFKAKWLLWQLEISLVLRSQQAVAWNFFSVNIFYYASKQLKQLCAMKISFLLIFILNAIYKKRFFWRAAAQFPAILT